MSRPACEPSLRFEVRPTDREAVRQIVESTRYFSAAETDVAVELVDERLAKGAASGYHFAFLEQNDQVLGYACYGPIACTVHSFDLYWIAVQQQFQQLGLGRRLVQISEQQVQAMYGRRIYVETSGREQYASTRRFYERCGYTVAAILPDFYDAGDDKVVYLKVLP